MMDIITENEKTKEIHNNILDLVKDKVGKVVTIVYDASCASGRKMTKVGVLVGVKEVPYFYREFSFGNLLTDVSFIEIMYEGRKNPQHIMFDQIYKIKVA